MSDVGLATCHAQSRQVLRHYSYFMSSFRFRHSQCCSQPTLQQKHA